MAVDVQNNLLCAVDSQIDRVGQNVGSVAGQIHRVHKPGRLPLLHDYSSWLLQTDLCQRVYDRFVREILAHKKGEG